MNHLYQTLLTLLLVYDPSYTHDAQKHPILNTLCVRCSYCQQSIELMPSALADYDVTRFPHRGCLIPQEVCVGAD